MICYTNVFKENHCQEWIILMFLLLTQSMKHVHAFGGHSWGCKSPAVCPIPGAVLFLPSPLPPPCPTLTRLLLALQPSSLDRQSCPQIQQSPSPPQSRPPGVTYSRFPTYLLVPANTCICHSWSILTQFKTSYWTQIRFSEQLYMSMIYNHIQLVWAHIFIAKNLHFQNTILN